MEFMDKVKLLDQDGDEIMGRIVKISEKKLLAKFTQNTTLFNFSNVRLILYHKIMGELIYKAEIYNTFNNYVTFTNLTFLDNVQKRNETRARYQIPLDVKKIRCDNSHEICLQKKLTLESIDLSASGIQLSCELNLPENISLFLELPIGGEILNCSALIVRKFKVDNVFHYGCRLMASEAIQNKIRRFVYKLQLEERKNLKEKNKYNEPVEM